MPFYDSAHASCKVSSRAGGVRRREIVIPSVVVYIVASLPLPPTPISIAAPSIRRFESPLRRWAGWPSAGGRRSQQGRRRNSHIT
jgi:hypothetical protein